MKNKAIYIHNQLNRLKFKNFMHNGMSIKFNKICSILSISNFIIRKIFNRLKSTKMMLKESIMNSNLDINQCLIN